MNQQPSPPHAQNAPAPPPPAVDARLRPAHWIAAALLLVVVGIAGWINLQLLLAPDAPVSMPPRASDARPSGDAGPGFLNLSSATHHPLNREPLGLTPYPTAKRLKRFWTRDGGWINEVSAFSIPPADAAPLLDHYQTQAATLGFSPARAQADPARQRLLIDEDEPHRFLSVSVIDQGSQVHALVLFSYATDGPAPGNAPGNSPGTVPRSSLVPDPGAEPSPSSEAPTP